MKLLDTLQAEHVLIDHALGSLRAYVEGLVAGSADVADGARFAAFFTDFAGRFHHEREESVLFRALVEQADLPADRGPVYAITREHAEMDVWLRELLPLLQRCPETADEQQRLRALATRYTRALWRHIDAENSVLYPQAQERLALCGVHELPDPTPDAVAAAARDAAAPLRLRYPPIEDQALARGDGCFMCRAHGDTCEGLEAEWWSELEWDEFFSRDASD